MATIFGTFEVKDNAPLNQVMTDEFMEHVQRFLSLHTDQISKAYSVFVDGETDKPTLRFASVPSGYMQEVGESASPDSIKVTRGWDCGFPLKTFATKLSLSDVAMAYMTAEEFEQKTNAAVMQNVNTHRREILAALLTKDNGQFEDPLWGTIIVRRLANQDGTLYPPAPGQNDDTQANHYLITNYAVGSISSTNNPIKLIADTLYGRLGDTAGGEGIAVFASTNVAQALLDANLGLVPAQDKYVIAGANVSRLADTQAEFPGRLLGRYPDFSAWLIEWKFVPNDYIIAVSLDHPKPLMRRVDPASTGIARGLHVVTEEKKFPFTSIVFRDRFGYGAGYRLNGVAVQVAVGSDYTSPNL